MSIFRALWTGSSVTRAYLNQRLAAETLKGEVIDIGGGRSESYLPDMGRSADVVFRTFDLKAGQQVDFEKDTLPVADGAYDTVLFLNVMEHIFNHQHIANEVVRIVRPGGQLIGFVPFLMWYHPDHSDYFRYTHESLEKIFKTAGATSTHIEPIAGGPATAAAHMVLQSLPRIIRPVVFIPFWVFDVLFRGLRGDRYKVFALGYFFVIKK